MMFGNLQALAATVIPQQTVLHHRFAGNITNDMGYQEPSYDDPVDITGSFQPMAAQDATKLGLDFRQVHATLHTSAAIALAGQGTQPDRIEYGGKLYDAIGVTDWKSQDGWAQYVLVAV
jgi:hypothetical protein